MLKWDFPPATGTPVVYQGINHTVGQGWLAGLHPTLSNPRHWMVLDKSGHVLIKAQHELGFKDPIHQLIRDREEGDVVILPGHKLVVLLSRPRGSSTTFRAFDLKLRSYIHVGEEVESYIVASKTESAEFLAAMLLRTML